MKFGRYEVVDKVGEGASGVLYQAHDPQMDRKIAVKVLRDERVNNPEFVSRFLKEAKAIGRLSHPNIVTAFDVGMEGSAIYLAMQFLDGTPLDQILQKGTLPLEKIVQMGIQLADALDYAHKQGVVHRDIKPPNIIVSDEDQAKITDFGTARVHDTDAASQTQEGAVLGTPRYMSPEQISGQKLDGRTDIYSLGVILFELVAGSPPFNEKTLVGLLGAITQKKAPELTRQDSSLTQKQTAKLYKIIQKCMEKDPANRFQSGADLKQALSECLSVEELPKGDSKKLLYYGTVSALVVIAALVVFLWPEKTQKLVISSMPPGAQIYIDGKYLGDSPADLDLAIGKHEVRLSKANHYPWEAQITLTAEKAEQISLTLIPTLDDENK